MLPVVQGRLHLVPATLTTLDLVGELHKGMQLVCLLCRWLQGTPWLWFVKAIVPLAWQLKWWQWVGATALAFYGAGRWREFLRCCRGDLATSEDRAHEGSGP